MLEDVLENHQHILICIQYEVLQKKFVDEAYKSFCNILGEDVMEYSEFDFWFYYFLNGNYDLDHDRSKYPKLRGLSDISIDMAAKIVEKLEWEEKCIFRNVSKKCREVVDKKPIIIQDIQLTDWNKQLCLKFNDKNFECGIPAELIETTETKAFETLVIQKLSIALNIPKLQINSLYLFIFDGTLRDKLIALFKSLNHQIHVESFEYNDDDSWKYPEEIKFMKFIPHLKPGVLKKIVLNSESFDRDLDVNLKKLSEFEQWKQAKELNTVYIVFDNIDKLAHFDRLEVLVDWKIKPESLIRLKNLYLNSSTFESCKLFLDGIGTADILRILGGDKFPMADGSTLNVDVIDNNGQVLRLSRGI